MIYIICNPHFQVFLFWIKNVCCLSRKCTEFSWEQYLIISNFWDILNMTRISYCFIKKDLALWTWPEYKITSFPISTCKWPNGRLVQSPQFMQLHKHCMVGLHFIWSDLIKCVLKTGLNFFIMVCLRIPCQKPILTKLLWPYKMRCTQLYSYQIDCTFLFRSYKPRNAPRKMIRKQCFPCQLDLKASQTQNHAWGILGLLWPGCCSQMCFVSLMSPGQL